MAELRSIPGGGGFDRLLAALDPEPVAAARKFSEVRSRLVRLFEWRGAEFPEDLADETITRVAHRLEEGLEIQAEDPYRFCCGVAFMIFKETLRKKGRRQRAFEEIGHEPPSPVDSPSDPRLECLERCLEDLDDAKRDLILRYYQGERRVKIDNRRRLAEELGVAAATLRLRVLRVRSKLEECVVRCLKVADQE